MTEHAPASRLMDRFDAAVAVLKAQHPADAPGFCIGLCVDGAPVRAVFHGLATLDWPQPLSGDTRFYLASESKPWVAALVVQSIAAGRITFDADMRDLLPALAGCTHPVRLGHLLRHTSGCSNPGGCATPASSRTPAACCRAVLAATARRRPVPGASGR